MTAVALPPSAVGLHDTGWLQNGIAMLRATSSMTAEMKYPDHRRPRRGLSELGMPERRLDWGRLRFDATVTSRAARLLPAAVYL
jgi:hypothetical protein